MESLYGDDLELLLDDCECVLVDFSTFDNNEYLGDEQLKISLPMVKIEKEDKYPSFPNVKIEEEYPIFPDAKIKQQPELYFNWEQESTTNNSHLLEEALRLNRELQKDFQAVIDWCENTLEYDLCKQNELEKEIAILKKRYLHPEETESDKTHKKPLLTISNFGAPYFKSNLILERVPPSKRCMDSFLNVSLCCNHQVVSLQ